MNYWMLNCPKLITKTLVCTLICSYLLYSTPIMSSNYLQNREPLVEVPFIALPVGAVKAEGWLLEQLLLQKEGLTGHAETLYNGKNDLGADNDWLGGSGDSWERAPYYTKGLVALAYVLDDVDLKAKAQKWIDWSLNNQRRTGYFGPANNPDWWARMPMLYAIRDYYEATGDERVIPFLTKYFNYQNNNIGIQALSSWGKSRAGDNIEIIFWLYNRTGDTFLLELADKLYQQAYPWTEIFTQNLFNQFGSDFQPKHNVNIPQAMKMPAIYYQRSKSDTDKSAFSAGQEHLLCDHGQPQGMQSGNEMVAGRSSMTGLELCSVVEQMQSSETALMILGDAYIGDHLEKVAFNALPGGLTSDIKGLQYYQQANQVISKFGYIGFAQNYDNGTMPGPYSGYGCCRFDFHMGYPYYVKNMWAATSDKGLAVMAYGPSKVTALVGEGVEVSVRETTGYPFSEQLTFTLTTPSSVEFPLKFRIPAWCKSPEIKVNGTLQTGMESGSFFTINRTWNNNDEVSINFPMPLLVNNEVNNSVSIQRGPLVFSLKIDENWSTRNDYGNGFKESEVLPASAWNYALIVDKSNPEATIQVVENTMPSNPFIQSETPVKLLVKARKLNSWVVSHNGSMATDPPYSPVETNSREEQVTLIPYGSQTLRATSLPVVGTPSYISAEFTEDFEDGQKEWVQYGGSLYVKEGQYHASNTEASHPGTKSVVPATQFSDFIYEADVQLNSDRGDAGLIFRSSRLAFGPDDYDGYYAGINSQNNTVVLGKANGRWQELSSATMELNDNEWYRIKIVAKGPTIKVFVNNMNLPVIEFDDTSFTSGSIGIRSYNCLASWDNLLVHSTIESGYSSTVKTEENIKLYPNPAITTIQVEVAHQGHLSVYDVTGREIKAESVSPGFVRINIRDYKDGIYLLQLKSSEAVLSSRFVKKSNK